MKPFCPKRLCEGANYFLLTLGALVWVVSMVVVGLVELVVYIDPPDEAGSTLPGSETCCYPSHLPPGAAFSSLTSSTLYMDVSPKASPWWLLKSWWDDLVGYVAGEGVEVLPVGVSVLRSQLVVAQISCLPRLPSNNLTCTDLSGTCPASGTTAQ